MPIDFLLVNWLINDQSNYTKVVTRVTDVRAL